MVHELSTFLSYDLYIIKSFSKIKIMRFFKFLGSCIFTALGAFHATNHPGPLASTPSDYDLLFQSAE